MSKSKSDKESSLIALQNFIGYTIKKGMLKTYFIIFPVAAILLIKQLLSHL